jgi:hypothetical protein
MEVTKKTIEQMKTIKQLIREHRYNSPLRSVTSDQILEMCDAIDNPDQMKLSLALMYLKQRGALWSLNKIKEDPTHPALLAYADRKTKSLIQNAKQAFTTLLNSLIGVTYESSSDSLLQQAKSQQALLELMWEVLSLEQKEMLMDLLDK